MVLPHSVAAILVETIACKCGSSVPAARWFRKDLDL
jgi:4-aminobutyrate aminotransferase-like enzyme